MFYEINGKPYVKTNGKYNEIIVKTKPNNSIIFVPTNNTLPIGEVGRNYSLLNVDTLRAKFGKECINNN